MRLNTKIIQYNFSKMQLLGFAVIFACIGGFLLLYGRAAGSTANVFVSSNGSDSGANCKRFATATANPDASGSSLCKTFQKAYSLITPGDTIEVESGNYPGQTILRGNVGQAGPMSTFKCAVVKQCILSSYITLGANNGGPTGVAPSYLTFDGFDAAGFNSASSGIDSDATNNPIPAVQSSDVVITNSWFHHWGCCAQNNSSTLILSGIDNFTVKNSEVGPMCCSGDGFETAGWYDPVTGTKHTMQNLIIDNVYVHDLFDTCSGTEGAATLYPGQCSGTGYGDCQTCGYDHNDGIQLYDGQNVVIKNSKWIRAGTQGIFVALYSAGDARLNGMTIENNIISDVLSGGNNDFSIGSQAGAGKISGTINILYNTVQKVTALGTLNDCPGGGNCYGSYDSTATVNIVGNIFNSFTFGNDGPVNGCNLWAYDTASGTSTTIVPNFKNNLINGTPAACDQSNINGIPTYIDSSYNTSNLHLANGSLGIDQGETIFCGPGKAVTTDIDNDSRPQGGACDIGADEYVPTANVWISTAGNDSTCVRGDSTKPCASWGKAWQIACGNDIIAIGAGTYGDQQILPDTNCNKAPSSPVTFQPDAGANVTLDGLLSLGANNGQASGNAPSGLTLNGLNRLTVHGGITSWYNGSYASNLVFENFHIWHTEAAYGPGGKCGAGACLFAAGGDNMTIHDVEIGPICCHSSGIDIGKPASSTRDIQNVSIDGINMHDVVRDCAYISPQYQANCTDNDEFAHVDGLHIWAADGLNITNSRWLNLSGQVLFLENTNCGHYENVLIQNNMISSVGLNALIAIGAQGCSYSQSNPFVSGYMKILYNSLAGGAGLNMPSYGSSVYSNNTTVTIAGNVGNLNMPCQGSNGTWVWDKNIWAINSPTPACPGDLPQADLNYESSFITNPGSCPPNYHTLAATAFDPADSSRCIPNIWDLHLRSSSAGINTASSQNCPATDIDGNSRPQGTACDAGADEYMNGAAGLQGDLNSDGLVNVTDLSIILSHYGSSGLGSQGDINGDGIINITDLSILLSHYGTRT